MVAYHCDSNAILAVPFTSKKDHYRLQAYDEIMQRLTDCGMIVDLQILDNGASAAYKRIITTKWELAFQLFPPNIHRRNASERAIWTFKSHFLAILTGVADDYPHNLWDLLLPQSVINLNLLRQATLNPSVSAWEFLERPLDYNANPPRTPSLSSYDTQEKGNKKLMVLSKQRGTDHRNSTISLPLQAGNST